MPLHTAAALILRTYKLGEADRIVVFLTDDRGKRRGVAKGARRQKSRFGGGLEPFTSVRLAYFEREQRELVQLRHVETICSPLSGPEVSALAHVGYFAELIDEWSLEGDPNEALFRLGSSVVEAIAAQVPILGLARYFEYWLLRLQGVYPAITDCAGCGVKLRDEALVIPTVGRVTCTKCEAPDNGVVLSDFSLAFLRRARTVSPECLGSVELSDSANRQLSDLHRRMIKVHLHKDLKSERVIRELTRRP